MKLRISFIVILCCAVAEGTAVPRSISFGTMVSKCKTIVIAKYLGCTEKIDQAKPQEFILEVQAELFGSAQQKTITVKEAYGKPHLSYGVQCIAFINQQGQFEWVGVAEQNEDVEKGVLKLSGFYSWNAYFVYPGIISVAQLKEYLETKKYTGSISGNLSFYDNNRKNFQTSGLGYKINYWFKNDSLHCDAKSNGFTVKDFKSDPDFFLDSYWRNGVVLRYEQRTARPFEIYGKVISVDSTGKNYTVDFNHTNPSNLTRELFVQYVEDPKLGPPCFEIEIKTDQDKKYLLKYNVEMGNGMQLYGYKDTILEGRGMEGPYCDRKSKMTFGKDYITFVFDTVPAAVCEEYRESDFIHLLQMTSITGELYLPGADKRAPGVFCTLSLKNTALTKNLNYKEKKKIK